jgi:hypothetical protein
MALYLAIGCSLRFQHGKDEAPRDVLPANQHNRFPAAGFLPQAYRKSARLSHRTAQKWPPPQSAR